MSSNPPKTASPISNGGNVGSFLLRCLVLVSMVSRGLAASSALSAGQFFNFEIAKRVQENLQFFLGQPETVQDLLVNARSNQLFDHDMTAPDRDTLIRFLAALPESILPSKAAYCGLEDGTNTGLWEGYAYYREPGNSGYTLNENMTIEEDNVNYKHFKSCFHWENGTQHDCVMASGSIYPKYQCEEDDTNAEDPDDIVNNDSDNDPEHCTPVYKPCPGDENALCKQYTLVTAGDDDVPRGHVPQTSYCIDATGGLTEEPGMALDYYGGGTLGDCLYYGSDISVQGPVPVAETTGAAISDYAYCRGKSPHECSSMFAGGFWSEYYDPRNRPWYTETKRLLRPNWAEPYPFAATQDMGITLSYPIFTTLDGDDDDGAATRRFDGVCAVDYRLKDFTDFLVETYQNSSTLIVLYEAEEPHRVIGSSTGTLPVRNGIHLSIDEFFDPNDSNGTALDEVLVQAYAEQASRNYPEGRLITVKISDEIDSDVYASQSTLYEYPGIEGLKWRVIIVSPGVRSDQDEILPGSGGTFALVIALATAGVLLCTFFCVALYRKRKERAVIFGDWRFTCAFIVGCVLMNTSSYAYLGPTTDSTCLLRMWMFHLMFAITLSPLFVKVYRMHRLVGSGQRSLRTTISNRKAATWTLPIVVVQVLLLIVSTFVLPPQAQEIIENNEGEELVLQRIVCASENPAMLIVRFTFEAILLLVGCILAYKTRDLKEGFGESKQLIFAMYNIALVMVIIGVVIGFVEMNASSKGLLLTIGVLWGTGFSAAAFVVPRMVQIKRQSRTSTGSSRISSLPTTRMGNQVWSSRGALNTNGESNVANYGSAKTLSGKSVSSNSQEPGEKSRVDSIEEGEKSSSSSEKLEAVSAEKPETAP